MLLTLSSCHRKEFLQAEQLKYTHHVGRHALYFERDGAFAAGFEETKDEGDAERIELVGAAKVEYDLIGRWLECL